MRTSNCLLSGRIILLRLRNRAYWCEIACQLIWPASGFNRQTQACLLPDWKERKKEQKGNLTERNTSRRPPPKNDARKLADQLQSQRCSQVPMVCHDVMTPQGIMILLCQCTMEHLLHSWSGRITQLAMEGTCMLQRLSLQGRLLGFMGTPKTWLVGESLELSATNCIT